MRNLQLETVISQENLKTVATRWQNFRLKYTKFAVSFPEKLLKIVATRGEIFSLKCTKYRLASLNRRAQLTRCFSTVAELLVFRRVSRSDELVGRIERLAKLLVTVIINKHVHGCNV